MSFTIKNSRDYDRFYDTTCSIIDSMVREKAFGEYRAAEIEEGAVSLSVTALGATARSLLFEGRECILGFQSPEEYLNSPCYVGGIVGRCAGRIAKATARIDDKKIFLIPNENENHLHGGQFAFDKRKWDMTIESDKSVKFTLVSQDLDNGYPGNLTAHVTYTVSGNEVRIDFEGESDADTLFGPTTHMYFKPGALGNALRVQMRIAADKYIAVDAENLPTGIRDCTDLYDFGKMREIGANIDHCFVLNGSHALCARTDTTQIDLYTDYPGVNLYTGAFLTGAFRPNEGFAIEPMFYPDAPNHPEFPSPVLRAGKKFHKYARYVFTKVK